MNLRQFSIALMISALPQLAAAGGKISLNKGDFLAAERITREGETLVSVKLSKSGKAKLKKLNLSEANTSVYTEVGGVASDFKLKVPIKGDGLEMGPYSQPEAQKVIDEINR